MRLERTPAAPGDAIFGPVSFTEEGVLVRSCLDPDGALYNEAVGFSLLGPIDTGRLSDALQAVSGVNESLRTSYPMRDGRWIRRVSPLPSIPFTVRDLAAGDDLADLIRTEIRGPFDLGSGPLFRAAVWRAAPADHVLVLTGHHSIVDGVALDILVEEVAAAYCGLPVQAKDGPTPSQLASGQRARAWSRRSTGRSSASKRGWSTSRTTPWEGSLLTRWARLMEADGKRLGAVVLVDTVTPATLFDDDSSAGAGYLRSRVQAALHARELRHRRKAPAPVSAYRFPGE